MEQVQKGKKGCGNSKHIEKGCEHGGSDVDTFSNKKKAAAKASPLKSTFRHRVYSNAYHCAETMLKSKAGVDEEKKSLPRRSKGSGAEVPRECDR